MSSPADELVARWAGDLKESDCTPQRNGWYVRGRIFRIWQEGNRGLHAKTFILHRPQNNIGDCFLVEILDEDELKQIKNSSSAFLTHVSLKSAQSTSLNTLPANQDNQLDQQLNIATVNVDSRTRRAVPQNAYINLERQYSIDFSANKYQDLGFLDIDSVTKFKDSVEQYRKWSAGID